MIDADLGLVEVQRQAGDAVAEVEHLVQHDVAEALDLGDAVADLADDADALLRGRGLGARDLRFDFLYQVSHCRYLTASNRLDSQARLERGQPARTLPSYTSLPTLMRMPPMSAGFSANDVSSPGP